MRPTNKVNVHLDLDGVFADFDKGVHLHTGRLPTEFTTNGEMWRELRKVPNFFLSLPPTPYCMELYSRIKGTCSVNECTMSILTGVSASIKSAAEQKLEWVRTHLGSIPFNIGPYAKDKWLHAEPNDILIDDRRSNIEDWLFKPPFPTRAILHNHGNWKWTAETLQAMFL